MKVKVFAENGMLKPYKESDHKKMREFIGLHDGKHNIFVMEVYSADAMSTSKQDSYYKLLVAKGSKESGMTFSEFEKELVNAFSPLKYTVDLLGQKQQERTPYIELNYEQTTRFLESCTYHLEEFYNIKL